MNGQQLLIMVTMLLLSSSDLRKAFDRVWHCGLLAKLAAAGVKGSAFKWFSSFLSGRCQSTLVDGSLSEFSPLHAGVPQGAILSPLLFSVYMNDIPSPEQSTNLFADDTSAFVISKTPDRRHWRVVPFVATVGKYC